MVQLDKVKIKIQEYILSQIDSLGATNPAIKLVKPLAKRAIVNNMDGIDKWFGSNFDEKIIASAVDFWFEDDDFDGNKVWKYFNEM